MEIACLTKKAHLAPSGLPYYSKGMERSWVSKAVSEFSLITTPESGLKFEVIGMRYSCFLDNISIGLWIVTNCLRSFNSVQICPLPVWLDWYGRVRFRYWVDISISLSLVSVWHRYRLQSKTFNSIRRGSACSRTRNVFFRKEGKMYKNIH